MGIESIRSIFQVSSSVSSNLCSGYLGLIVLSPSIYPKQSAELTSSIITNVGFAILCFVASTVLNAKSYDL